MIDNIKNKLPRAYTALQANFVELGIPPDKLISEPNGICFTDFIESDSTFKQLFEFIQK